MTDSAGEPADIHASSEAIAAYLSDALPADERSAVEAHLARCRPCRRQVTSAQALLRTRPRPLRWVGLAAAAALAIAMLRPWSLRDARTGVPTSDIERANAGTRRMDGIIVLAPADGDTISTAGASFAWRSPGPEVLYHLSLTNPSGRALWTTETRDTTATLPPNVLLEPGARYFWYVDALGANAASWTTGTHAFVAAP